jgi:hypothetical protein
MFLEGHIRSGLALDETPIYPFLSLHVRALKLQRIRKGNFRVSKLEMTWTAE